MLDAVKFYDKVAELEKQHTELLEQRNALIVANDEAIKTALDKACKEYLESIKENVIKEVIGEELTILDSKIALNKEIFDTLKNLETVSEEEKPEIN